MKKYLNFVEVLVGERGKEAVTVGAGCDTANLGGFLVAKTFQAAQQSHGWRGTDPSRHPLLHPSISLLWTEFLCSWRSLLLPACTLRVV